MRHRRLNIPTGKWVSRTYNESGKRVKYWIYKDRYGKVIKRKAKKRNSTFNRNHSLAQSTAGQNKSMSEIKKDVQEYRNNDIDPLEKKASTVAHGTVAKVPYGTKTVDIIERETGQKLIGGDSAYRRIKKGDYKGAGVRAVKSFTGIGAVEGYIKKKKVR